MDEKAPLRAVTLALHCADRDGMLADVTAALAELHIPLREASAHSGKRGRGVISVTVAVRSFRELEPIAARLRQIEGVVTVEHGSQQS